MPSVFRELAHALASLTTNCHEFHKAWNRTKPARRLHRHWKGEWRSEANQHHGLLNCVIDEIGGNNLKVFFHAKYSKILRVCYSVQMSAHENSNGVLELKGKTNLGKLAGGNYTYEGQLSRKRFVCKYRCRYDFGTFILRPVRTPTK